MRKNHRSQKKLNLTKQIIKQLTLTLTDEQLKNAAGGMECGRTRPTGDCG